MTKHKHFAHFTSIALLCVIVALLGFQAFGSRAALQSDPGVVATFDLERLFNSIDQRPANFAEIPGLQEKFQAENEKRRREIEDLTADLELHARGSAKYNELQESIVLRTHQYRAYVEFSKMKLETESGRAIKKTYEEIRLAASEFARANNIALVMVDDSKVEIPPGTIEDLNRQISARRVFYSAVDITDDLIAFMNDKFKAAGGVVPPRRAPNQGAAAVNP